MRQQNSPRRMRYAQAWVESAKHQAEGSLLVNHDLILQKKTGAEVHVGNVPITQMDFDYLQAQGFDAVLDLCCDNAIEHSDCAKRGIIQHSEFVEDVHSPTQRQLDFMTLFIEGNLKAWHKVYIHCHAGAGRAPTVACAWLIRYHGFSVDEALAHLRKTRRYHKVSENQIEGLIEFAARHARAKTTKRGK